MPRNHKSCSENGLFTLNKLNWQKEAIYHHHGASIFGRSREGYGRYDFPVFSRIWVSTVELVTQSSILLSGGGGR